MKNTLTLLLLVFTLSALNAQKIKFKKNTIFIDGKEVLSYDELSNDSELIIYELNTKTPILSKIFNHSGTYNKVLFINQGKMLETHKHWTKKEFMNWLLEQSIFTINGEFKPENLDLLIDKYHTQISR